MYNTLADVDRLWNGTLKDAQPQAMQRSFLDSLVWHPCTLEILDAVVDSLVTRALEQWNSVHVVKGLIAAIIMLVQAPIIIPSQNGCVVT